MRTATVDNDLRDVLSVAVIEGPHVRLVGRLDPTQYKRVNQVLEALGGKWNRQAKAHIFPSDDHAAAVAEAAETGQFIHPKLNGYFPTPAVLARQLVEMANIRSWHSVLEPSAGRGALADVAIEYLSTMDLIECVELLPDNVAALQSKGYDPVEGDFLQIEPIASYERIVMNPPFQRRAYVAHILHAWEFLAPGGVLAAIAPAFLSDSTDRAAQRLLDLMDEHGATVIDNPDGAFEAAGTNVRTIRFVMEKAVPV